MKTFDVTHEEIIDFENLFEAHKNALQHRHYCDENLKFAAHREEELDLLHNESR